MEQIDVITIFPEMLAPYLDASIIGKARERGLVSVNVHNLRDHTEDKHRTTDDTPYGGGPGMVMMAKPVFDCFEHVESLSEDEGPVIILTPQGQPFTSQVLIFKHFAL